MRVLEDVINTMFEVIPASEVALKQRLESVKQSSLYRAPEIRGIDWQDAQDVLCNMIPVPTEGWHFELQKIWNGSN